MAPRVLKPSDDAILEAARLLRAGEPVAFPTETVYGLGADARDDRAVAGVFAAKGRPRFNPLIVHWRDAEAAARAVRFDGRAERLAAKFWPGPLTLVLPRRAESGVSLLCSVGLDTLAVRVPRHEVAQRLLAAFDGPIAAPSANRSGAVSPTTADHVVDSLGDRVLLILDGGRCPLGLESTVVDLSGPAAMLLRPGAVTAEALEAELGPLATAPAPERGHRSPGQMASHYAPHLPLRLEVTGPPRPGEALLAFGPEPPAGYAETLNLSRSGDLAEAAANLFAMLRALDKPAYEGIAAMPVPERGLGRAINDRLRRAAAPRA
ncbi:MAG TPA: L-threonylcarbamoyladenylate synthase [Alphaproteobacteria bacterium]|nr:L-threonylcarbamoyladenylate synthase [Alphaproteobacteria bacterium]